MGFLRSCILYCIFWVTLWGASSPAAVHIGDTKDDGLATVTFRFKPPVTARTVGVAGDFNQWNLQGNPMQDEDGDGIWETRLQLRTDREYQYKFVIDDVIWLADPDNVRRSDDLHGNSILTFPGSPLSEKPETDLVPLHIHYRAPGHERVALIYGLNGWTPPPPESRPAEAEDLGGPLEVILNSSEEGVFTTTLSIPRGSLVDFVIHILEPEELWDNNGGEGVDFHLQVDGPQTAYIQAPIGGQLAAPASPPSQHDYRPFLAGLALLGVLVVALHGILIWRWGTNPLMSRIAVIVWIALLALAFRAADAQRQTPQVDELAYVPLAMMSTDYIREGEISRLSQMMEIAEHPRLPIALFSVAGIIGGVDRWNYVQAQTAARWVSIILAGCCAAMLAIRSPLAGLIWTVSCISVVYTSIAYLDSTMTFFVVGCVLAFELAWRRRPVLDNEARIFPWNHIPWIWLGLSAVCAGAAVSSKYLAAPAPLTIAAFFMVWLIRAPGFARKFIALIFMGYVALALITMVLTDWHLWVSNPVERIIYRLTFHRQFSASDLVAESAFPWYQPVVWLWTFASNSEGAGWAWIDKAITLLGLGGLFVLARRAPVLGVTGLMILGFLFLWPTKWPQYEVVLIPWLALGAAELISSVGEVGNLTRTSPEHP